MTHALRIAPPAFLEDPALQAVLRALPGARLVGGCVRDALAGRPVADIDLATPDPPARVIERLNAAGLRAVPTGLRHGTVTAVSGGRGFEVTTLRHDVATDGRHAQVAFTDDWHADAARRDFTINALSMTPDGQVYDDHDGLADLRDGRVRFVGDPATRIAEDYLRILRFFRFHARFGRGAPDTAALEAIRNAVPGLARLSAERVWSELKRILAACDPAGAVALMAACGVLPAVLPEGSDPAALARLLASSAPPDPLLRLAALLTGDLAAFAERLRLSTAEREFLVAARVPEIPVGDDDAALRRWLADTPKPALIGRIWLAGGDEALVHRLEAMAVPVFPLRGRDLERTGVPAGPEMGTLLRTLRDRWLAGGCVAGATELLQWVEILTARPAKL